MKYLRFFVLVAVLGLLVGGCRKNDAATDPQVTDQDLISAQISTLDSVAEFVNTTNTMIDDGGTVADDMAKTTVAIKVFSWGRKVEWVDKVTTIELLGDTMAIATVTKTIHGHFVVNASYSDTAKHPDTVIAKPYVEKVRQKIRFRRTVHVSIRDRVWVPVSITLAEGNTVPDSLNKFTIASLELMLPLGNDTITDPLDTWMKFNRLFHGIPVLHDGDSVGVRVTINSTDTDTERAVLRTPVRKNITAMKTRRVFMNLESSVPNGSGFTRVYSRTFRSEVGTNMIIGRFNAVLDVFSHGSFYDDAAPFSNRLWELPYMVLYR